MSLLVLIGDRDPQPFVDRLFAADSELPIQVWPELQDPDSVRLAVTWAHPPGVLRRCPNLEVVASLGAGIDHLVADPDLPKQVSVTRVVCDHLGSEMEQYLVATVFNQNQSRDAYGRDKSVARWSPQARPQDPRIGILGLGELGMRVANSFAHFGLNTSGWSRSPKTMPSISCYHGEAGLATMLRQLDYLINLLPLTPKTENILAMPLFRQLKPGCFLINVARGRHLVEQDLLEALDQGMLSGACLDVFRDEPLPTTHPFWKDPRIAITPHVAARTSPDSAARQVAANYRRLERGEELLYLVDANRGY